MKKKIVLLLTFVLLLSLVGCGRKLESTTTGGDSSGKKDTVLSVLKPSKKTPVVLRDSCNFSDGRAWITYQLEEDSPSLYGCIDKTGSILFYITPDKYPTIATPYSSGYSVLQYGDRFYVLDKNGTVCSTYDEHPSDDFNSGVIVGGDGYIWTYEYTSGFDKAYYTYQLHAPNGNVITEFVYNGTEEISKFAYCGKGVWEYWDYDAGVYRYFCAQSNKWVEHPDVGGMFSTFYGDEALIGIDYDESDNVTLWIMDTQGNTHTVTYDRTLAWNWNTESLINENLCVSGISRSFGSLGEVSVCNTKTGEMAVLGEKYTDKLISDPTGVYTNGIMPLAIQGQDEETYIIFFDASLNPVSEPINVFSYLWTGELLIFERLGDNGFTVSDSNGNIRFTSDEKGYSQITGYYDGVARVRLEGKSIMGMSKILSANDSNGFLSGEWIFIDTNGDPIFEVIDASSAKLLGLN